MAGPLPRFSAAPRPLQHPDGIRVAGVQLQRFLLPAKGAPWVYLGSSEGEAAVKFLSAEDVPLEVLQVTGILLDGQGNVLRAGGEGIISKDTPFWIQIFDARQGIADATLDEAVLSALPKRRSLGSGGKP